MAHEILIADQINGLSAKDGDSIPVYFPDELKAKLASASRIADEYKILTEGAKIPNIPDSQKKYTT